MNLISGITNTGVVRFQTYSGTMTAERFIGFLEQLLATIRGTVFVLVDNSSAHVKDTVTAWIERHADRPAPRRRLPLIRWRRPAASPRCHRHRGAVPGRRADGHHGECHRERPGIPARIESVSPRPSPSDGGLEPGETENDSCCLTQHLLAVQPRRRDFRQIHALEESAFADLLDATLGR